MSEPIVKAKYRGKKVILSLKNFNKLMRYISELKSANKKLNKQIEAYNDEFTN